MNAALNAYVAVIEDSLLQAKTLERMLVDAGFRVRLFGTAADALAAFQITPPAVAVIDLVLPDRSGVEVLEALKALSPGCSTVMVTNNASVNSAIEAMRAGAFDYIVKPLSRERLVMTVRNAVERHELRAQVQRLATVTGSLTRFHGFMGSSAIMNAVYGMIRNVAPSKAPVFITGESGTGKELAAHAIHAESARREQAFVPINCAAIPASLMESELFGHVRGAFTNAVSDREGAAARASGGTLFFDEICELPIDLQPKLLRLIETQCFQPVGGTREQPVDIRFVSATNRDPLAEIAAGRLREDLFYRLHVVPLRLPPLRERGDDAQEIGQELLRAFTAEEGRPIQVFTAEALELLRAHGWPGNVRELKNVIRNLAVLGTGPEVTPDMLSGLLQRKPVPLRAPALKAGTAIRPLWLVEREAIREALALCGGNMQKAAAFLEISQSTLYRKKAEMELQDGESRELA
ncbi:MAG: sigma-54 dependent transcriptional regulator [Aestuariivirgaceae bacterium]|nr:sigma-54 dependent transcriptional regulator [Aestuariivirgaceae bacterium]